MGRENYKTVTLPRDFYEELQRFFEENRQELRRMGITSISGLATRLLSDGLERLKAEMSSDRR